MAQSTDKRPFQPVPNSTAGRLMANRERIVSEWVSRVRQNIQGIAIEEEPIVVDTIPALLENLAQALDQTFPRSLATDGTTIANEHGGERARVTRSSPGELLKEFQILRSVIIEILASEQPLKSYDMDIIIRSIDQAMTESLIAYFLVHQGVREQFISVLTHDLRTPLTAIKTTSDLILRNPSRVDQVPRLAAGIAENVRRIDQMIRDLLDASRVQFGEAIHFEVQEFELYSLLQDTLDQLKASHGDRFLLYGKARFGYWNKDAFKRAVENLVLNAIKYGDPIQPITIRLEETHGRVIVSVHNEGSYIPTEEQETLFRSFMRAQSAKHGNMPGWGLGLAMVRGMAEGHGGSVTVDSAPERGTTFYIDVPIDSRPHLTHPITPGV